MDTFALQKALFARLSQDPDLIALGVAVYDVAPQGADGNAEAAFPYLLIGEMDVRDAGTQSSDLFDVMIRLHSFSASGAFSDTRAIQLRAFNLLHRKTFAVEGHHLIMCRRNISSIDRDPDGIVHGVCDYRVLVEAGYAPRLITD